MFCFKAYVAFSRIAGFLAQEELELKSGCHTTEIRAGNVLV